MDLDRRKFLQFAGAATAATASVINDVVTFEAEAAAIIEPVVAETPFLLGTAPLKMEGAVLTSMGSMGVPSWVLEAYKEANSNPKVLRKKWRET